MKKAYISPVMDIDDMELECSLLQSSPDTMDVFTEEPSVDDPAKILGVDADLPTFFE